MPMQEKGGGRKTEDEGITGTRLESLQLVLLLWAKGGRGSKLVFIGDHAWVVIVFPPEIILVI